MVQTSQKMSNLQLELLKLYANQVSDDDLRAIHLIMSNYFANKAIEEANRVWDAQNWNDQKVNELLNSHLRTPYHQA